MSTEVKKRLENVFIEVFDDLDIKIFEEMTARDIDEWDSLMHINLIIAIEKEFGIKFKVPELSELKTVGDTMALIAQKIDVEL